jgi:hypothetical protein
MCCMNSQPAAHAMVYFWHNVPEACTRAYNQALQASQQA